MLVRNNPQAVENTFQGQMSEETQEKILESTSIEKKLVALRA